VTYIHLDTALFTNPKILAVGKDARDLYIGALMWSRENLTDGVIPRSVLHLLDPTIKDAATARRLATKLVDKGLMEGLRGSNGHLTIRDYGDYQQTKAEVERAREQAKDRQRRWRDKRVSNAVSNETRSIEEVKDIGFNKTRNVGPTCPHCGVQHTTEAKLTDHLRNVHLEEATA
jgi:hypothetical protein